MRSAKWTKFIDDEIHFDLESPPMDLVFSSSKLRCGIVFVLMSYRHDIIAEVDGKARLDVRLNVFFKFLPCPWRTITRDLTVH